MYGKQKGFTLIEILVVVTIIGVLAGLVVVLIPKSQFEQAKLGCTNNVRNLVGLLQQTATANSKYPNESGPNMLLYYVVRRDGLDPDSEDRLNLLFCPADAQEDLDKAGGKEAFKKLDLSKRDYGALTSYAVNDQENGSCAVKPTGPDKVLLADDDEPYGYRWCRFGGGYARAWAVALRRSGGATALSLTRQGVPVLETTDAASVARGAYAILGADEEPEIVLVASGSEVAPALRAGETLRAEGVKARVVSMPSFELFAAQDEAWRESVLPAACTVRVGIEAATRFGWDRWIGPDGAFVGMDRFGASAPGAVLGEKFGFTEENVLAVARARRGG